jgi:nicotinamidase-related amidase
VTEICVDKAARGLIERGYRLDIVADAVRHLDADAARNVIDYVLDRGGRAVTSEEITSLAG